MTPQEYIAWCVASFRQRNPGQNAEAEALQSHLNEHVHTPEGRLLLADLLWDRYMPSLDEQSSRLLKETRFKGKKTEWTDYIHCYKEAAHEFANFMSIVPDNEREATVYIGILKHVNVKDITVTSEVEWLWITDQDNAKAILYASVRQNGLVTLRTQTLLEKEEVRGTDVTVSIEQLEWLLKEAKCAHDGRHQISNWQRLRQPWPKDE
jgi:hypothetical protein